MNKATFNIMYKALMDIASAQNFFDESKQLSAIAATALKAIAQVQNTQDSND